MISILKEYDAEDGHIVAISVNSPCCHGKIYEFIEVSPNKFVDRETLVEAFSGTVQSIIDHRQAK